MKATNVQLFESALLDSHPRLIRCENELNALVWRWQVIGDDALPNLYIAADGEGEYSVSTLLSSNIHGRGSPTRIEVLSNVTQVIELVSSRTLSAFRSGRRLVNDADLSNHVCASVSDFHTGMGVAHWVYSDDLVVDVAASGECELTIGNAIHRGAIDDTDIHLWAWAIGEGYEHNPLSSLPVNPTDQDLILYFHELAVRGALYHLDDDPSSIAFTNAFTSAERKTLVANHDRMWSENRTSTTNLWNIYGSRPCISCNETTFVNCEKCCDCS